MVAAPFDCGSSRIPTRHPFPSSPDRLQNSDIAFCSTTMKSSRMKHTYNTSILHCGLGKDTWKWQINNYIIQSSYCGLRFVPHILTESVFLMILSRTNRLDGSVAIVVGSTWLLQYLFSARARWRGWPSISAALLRSLSRTNVRAHHWRHTKNCTHFLDSSNKSRRSGLQAVNSRL